MNIVQWIASKRDGQRLNDHQISALVDGYTEGSVPDYQMAALAMAIYFQGMDVDEVICLTRQMLNSGQTLAWKNLERPVVDKHSTGGIGDKVSIILAPLLAAAGLAVPMISGRGLGATGGTLDKLESIPGLAVDLSLEQIQKQVREIGCVIAGASREIAPADRRIYALRDVTATVPSIPLITGSILSKKLAEGLDALVLDVKFGSGAFMKTPDRAAELADSLVDVANKLGVMTSALLTDMNQPLGRMVGNANEINESVEVLRGGGPDDVRLLTIELAARLMESVSASPAGDARSRLAQLIDGGQAMEHFEQMVNRQGGKWRGPLPCAPRHPLLARTAGWIAEINCEQLGWSIIELGGGRKKLGDSIDHRAGLEMLVRIGERVDAGQPVLNLFCDNDDFGLVEHQVHNAIAISETPVAQPDLFAGHLGPEG